MLTVKDCYHKAGYSGCDHLLDNAEFRPLIGKQFQSLAEAMDAAHKLGTGTNGCQDVPIGMVVIFENGSEQTF